MTEENEPKDWEVREEEIPPSLRQKWDRARRRGVRGGVCRSCGVPYTEEDLSCPACGAPTEFPADAFNDFFLKLTRSFWGRAAILAVTVALGLLLFRAF